MYSNFYRTVFATGLCLVYLFSGCKQQEFPKPVAIVAEGRSVKPGTLEVEKQSDDVYDKKDKYTFVPQVKKEYGQYIITATNTDQSSIEIIVEPTDLQVGKSYNLLVGKYDPSSIEFADGQNGNVYRSSDYDNDVSIITITKVDTVNKKISGSFDLYPSSYSYSSSSDLYKGYFTDLPYTESGTGKGRLKVDVNGTTYTGSPVTVRSNGMTEIDATFANGSNLNMIIDGQDKGTYKFTNISGNSAEFKSSSSSSYVYTNDYAYYTADEKSKVVITSVDATAKTISGYFYQNLNNYSQGSKVLSKGVFYKIPYTTNNSIVSNAMVATVDGNSWNGSTITKTPTSSGFDVTAIASDNSKIKLSFPSNPTTGNHDLGYNYYYATFYTSSNSDYSAYNGTVNISSIDALTRTMKGTFNFTTAYSSSYYYYHNIQSASFIIKY